MIWVKRSIVIVLIVAVWGICSRAGLVNDYLLPAPWKIGALAWDLACDGTLWRNIRISLYRVFLGFGITFCIAFPLAVLIGLSRLCLELLETPLEFVRHIPPLATTPLLILWLGIGEASKLAVIVLATFFPVFLNTISGVSQCDSKLIEVGQVLGLRPFERIVRIILPSALPVIIVGMRLGFGYSWRALIGAELLAATAGLGYMIIEAEELARPDIVLVGIITIGTLGHLLDAFFLKLSRRIIPWQDMEARLDRS
jgi:sulfonate transport system permease protein